MRVLSCTVGHDASITILNDGKIELYRSASRLTRYKHDWQIIKCIKELISTNNTTFDSIVVYFYKHVHEWLWRNPLEYLFKQHFICDDITWAFEHHHLYHAHTGYYHSFFDEALVVVLDGFGSELIDGDDFVCETESVYHVCDGHFKSVHKGYCKTPHELFPHDILLHRMLDYSGVDTDVGLGIRFEEVSRQCGFGQWGAGKVMGLAPYNHIVDEKIDKWMIQKSKWIQEECENYTINLINKYKHRSNNIIISGGYALNCVANTRFKHTFPNHNIQIDPICADDGLSIGLAYYHTKDNVQRLQSPYIGTPLNPPITSTTTYHDVAQLIAEGHVVGMCQGKSEGGYRALGNRSLLFDPRLTQEHINNIKGREHWRPFAGTVLQQYASKWFDVDNSPYMQYTVNVKSNSIPAITHVDNTCRVQTVDSQQNYHFYHLINAFNDITSIPILGNTSFNYSGEDIAETYQQALDTARKMKIKYLFVPDVMGLVLL